MAPSTLNNFLTKFIPTYCYYSCATSVAALAQAPPPAGFPGKAPEGPAAEIVRFEAAPQVDRARRIRDPSLGSTEHLFARDRARARRRRDARQPCAIARRDDHLHAHGHGHGRSEDGHGDGECRGHDGRGAGRCGRAPATDPAARGRAAGSLGRLPRRPRHPNGGRGLSETRRRELPRAGAQRRSGSRRAVPAARRSGRDDVALPAPDRPQAGRDGDPLRGLQHLPHHPDRPRPLRRHRPDVARQLGGSLGRRHARRRRRRLQRQDSGCRLQAHRGSARGRALPARLVRQRRLRGDGRRSERIRRAR